MKINILTPKQMRELSNYGLDTSDASLYINDVTADDIDNGQLLVNLFPNDGSRQHEIEHSHVIFIYSVNDAMQKILDTNVQITSSDGMHTVYVYSGEMYKSDKAISDVESMLSMAREAENLCDANKPWQLEYINEIINCLNILNGNIIVYPNTKIEYKEELILEAFNVSKNVLNNFTDNFKIQRLINKIMESLQKLKQSYKSIVFTYKSHKYNELLFECMKYLLSNGKKLKRLS